MEQIKMKQRLFLIDGSSYIYRAFHALPYLSNSRGLPTNAIYGFTNMLLKVMKDFEPAYLSVVFDSKGPTFRSKIFAEYKAHRPEVPDSLEPQFPYIKELVSAFSISSFEMAGYEADDIIATVAKKMAKKGFDVVIVTGDKDMLQLVDDRITILDTMKDKMYGIEEVKERYGVEPAKIVEIMGLAGDSVDNIPGVPGIGEKTAKKLIAQFGTVEKVLERQSEVSGEKLREKIQSNESLARLSRELAILDTHVPVDFSFESLSLKEPDLEKLKSLFTELEFMKFLKEIAPKKCLDTDRYKIIFEEETLTSVMKDVEAVKEVAITVVVNNNDFILPELVGLSLSYPGRSKNQKSVYLPLAHHYSGAPNQLDFTLAMNSLKPCLENSDIKKYGHNIKNTFMVFKQNGVRIQGISGDTMIASYLLNPSKRTHDLSDLSQEYLAHQTSDFSDVVGKGKKEIPFSDVACEQAAHYTCENTEISLLIFKKLLAILEKDGLLDIFNDIEIPLIEVLAEMEIAGVKVDTEVLKSLSSELENKLENLTETIYTIAGEAFNINSPKQLGSILFEKLGLKAVKKTKTGYSTNEDVLKILSTQHDLPAEILNYRHLTKLKSTYVDALLSLIKPGTGRVHTSFNQTITATGRLSSSNPNLQNIPIRSELGQRIREAFVSKKGTCILSADYSQIELRIVAHLSQDQLLIDAFKKEEDIHTRTASEVFGDFPENMRAEMRRRAKAINFGIIYGISPFGLSQELGVAHDEARRYIDDYFTHYSGVKSFIDKTIKDAEENGFVTTIFGRRRHIHELKSDNPSVRGFGERMAINTPIQGTSADIIKIAMINIQRRFREASLQSLMVLQIHDELLFEVYENELDAVKDLVRKEMEGVIDLIVPIKVDINVGKNWREAH